MPSGAPRRVLTRTLFLGTRCRLPTEKFFELTQRYGRGLIRMLAHSVLIKCGVSVTTDGISVGYISVARLENDLDWYVRVNSVLYIEDVRYSTHMVHHIRSAAPRVRVYTH